jgi:hypothetical protein
MTRLKKNNSMLVNSANARDLPIDARRIGKVA